MTPAGILSTTPRFTWAEYAEAVAALFDGATQLEPDRQSCAVCGDTGHQAWECHHNPLAMMREAQRLQHTWRCFMCGEVLTDENAAELHFGHDPDGRPLCCQPWRVQAAAWLANAADVADAEGLTPPEEIEIMEKLAEAFRDDAGWQTRKANAGKEATA